MSIDRDDDRIPLPAIMAFLDWQNQFYEGEDREILIKACDLIYDHIHKDDPEEPHGN